jgi:hypothetical protein
MPSRRLPSTAPTFSEPGAEHDVERAAALKELQRLPGVGPSIARDLVDQGFRRIDQLRRCDPQTLYERQCALQGGHVDRCWLYEARCIVYAAETEHPEPEKLKWWHWKD